jgi:AcrR family transcriptional regulator
MSDQERPGLREMKKRRTRETIARVAMNLFDENGYAGTTIAQIAEAAEVSPRTVSTYFPLKEELVFESWGEQGASIEASLRLRDPGETTLHAFRSWLLGERELWERREPEMRRQRRIIDSSEELQRFEHSRHHDFEKLLAANFADDLGQSPDDLEPRLAAAATVAVFSVLSEERFRVSTSEIPSLSHQLTILDKALSFIGAGVSAVHGSQWPDRARWDAGASVAPGAKTSDELEENGA